MSETLGTRIASRIDALTPQTTRKAFAAKVGLTPDALSRALTGQRGISSLELLRIAEALDADMHELVTGKPDPRRVRLAARHDFDHDTNRRSVPSFAEDKGTLEMVRVAYVQAELPSHPPEALPASPDALRERLGDEFVRTFIARIESELGVDVVRLPGLGTAYTATMVGRRVIMLPATGNWFRENWDLAHEIGHLVGRKSEGEANTFAAELLLPESLLHQISWKSASAQTVADFLWKTGVSTQALKHRLSTLNLGDEHVRNLLDCSTQHRLRHAHSWSRQHADQITERMTAASTRHFPLALQAAHEQKVEAGLLGTGYLAWMLDVPEAALSEEYHLQSDELPVDKLAAQLGLEID